MRGSWQLRLLPGLNCLHAYFAAQNRRLKSNNSDIMQRSWAYPRSFREAVRFHYSKNLLDEAKL
jgi:hypothetical protein